MKRIGLLFVIALIILPFISADLITPGFHSISIVNNITNFNELSDYYLLNVCKSPMQQVSLMKDGIIGSCYKFSSLSVYVVKKTDFNVAEIDSINNLNYPDFATFLNQSRFKEVLTNIEHYKTVPVVSSVDSVYNGYIINASQLKTEPDNSGTKRNNLKYFYIGISILALVIIAILLIRRRK